MKYLLLHAGAVASVTAAGASEVCSTFGQVFSGPEDMCNRLYGEAFLYTEDESKAFTMWHFDDTNPNDQTSINVHGSVPTTCEVEYLHKKAPTPEAETFTECHPWRESACCEEKNVNSLDVLKHAYGEEYRWDLCGPLTSECERFYVQENCFYECDVNLGYYRKYKDMSNPTQKKSYDERCDDTSPQYDAAYAKNNASMCSHYKYDKDNDAHNKWEINRMPIKASYCKAWFGACRDQPIVHCGNAFTCGVEVAAALPEKTDDQLALGQGLGMGTEKTDDQLALGLGLGLGMGALVVIMVAGIVVLVVKEKRGKPMFTRLGDDPDKNDVSLNTL